MHRGDEFIIFTNFTNPTKVCGFSACAKEKIEKFKEK